MKKIVILTSGAAGGQASITDALTQTLSMDYTVTSISFFYELLGPLDIAHRSNAESMYNWIALRKWNWFINKVFYNVAMHYYRLRRNKILNLIRNYLIQQKPAAVISVIPFVNGEILQVTKELNIPFLLFSADLDPEMYLLNIKNPGNNFYLGLPFFDEQFNSLLAQHNIGKAQLIITGYPMRPNFMPEKDSQKIRQEFAIPKNKSVILVLLGSQGTKTLPEMIQQIYQIKTPAHILICTGKAEHLAKKVRALQLPAHITSHIIGYTNRIADLMAITDLFITKSGAVSVAEALYMHVPMILDATSEVLVWEQFNHDFVQKNGVGLSVSNLDDLATEIDGLLLDKRSLALMRQNLKFLEKKPGCQNIKQLIDQITTLHQLNKPLAIYA